ncbi:hypothetical protein BS50DRAFT_197223 [Corynespora cassiicola Philippines]|uniref:Uncharacterized protein n=1 Tax=Corynespora cassiicola Philippines TaxID=1448308 RepID=A0A2T2N5K9_CORCC|nr:hypothetical protein BS50DRAFT_197223 [Corynespora cassiicola Philippines]
MSTDTKMSRDTDSPKEEKRRRRFSSPFHRSSRSRSRPNSIVLPSNHYDFGTPRGTPPRETPPAEGNRSRSQSQSFHAPDSWNIGPVPESPRVGTQQASTGLSPPERLGVLPSPAKSAFSLFPIDKEGEVPPVPKIPDDIEEQRGRRSEEGRSHQVLQSVIRNSPPPPPTTTTTDSVNVVGAKRTPREASRLQDSPVIEERASSEVQRKGDVAPDANAGSAAKVDVDVDVHDDDDRPPQLNHDPIPPQSRSDELRHGAEAGAPVVAEGGDVSPVMMFVGPEKDGGESGLKPSQVGQDYLSQTPSYTMGDVSPMFPPAKLTVGPDGDAQTAADSRAGGHADTRPAYETELIGAGDVSPVSSKAEDKQPGDTKITAGPSNPQAPKHEKVKSIEVKGAQKASSEAGPGGVAPARTPHAGENGTAPPRPVATKHRPATSPYQVVHAVEYVPSHSSFESWDQDSIAAPSQSDGSQLGDRPDESASAIPPVPQLPPAVQQHDEKPDGVEVPARPSKITVYNTPPQDHPSQSVSSQDSLQQPMSESERLSANRRSQSLLSVISSMVPADGAPISPASSQGRSRPSSRNRQQVPSAKVSPLSEQIVEEPAVQVEQRTVNGATAADDHFDLYADHDGIVKGVQDERGQPLRVPTDQPAEARKGAQQPASAPTSAPAPEIPKAPAVPPMTEEETRYSFERPMSFVSGPRDSHGRPQDHINRPGTGHADVPPVPQIPNRIQEQQRPLHSNGIISGGRSDVSSLQNSQRSHVRTPPHSNVSPPPPSNASPPPQASPPPTLAHRPLLQEARQPGGPYQDPRMMQDPRFQDPRLAGDPRMHGMAPGQPIPQDPQMQGQIYAQDPRLQQPGMSPPGPRNQFEFQQQLMQRQAMGQRMPSNEQQQIQAMGSQPPPPPPKNEEKSRPKLSSVFKGLASKSSAHSQQHSQHNIHQQENRAPSHLSASSQDPNRSGSYQSTLGDLPSEQIAAKMRDPRMANQRPGSMGAESFLSHESTRAQAADSRLDLRHPASPPPFNGIPPPQPPQGVQFPSKQAPPMRASMSAVPEPGKKKRFSALGNLFNRNSGGQVPTKVKLSKEEKKAQKAQKHSTAPPMQLPPQQTWSQHQQQQQQQQQQQTRAQQQGVSPYGQAPPRPFPGMAASPQTMSPMSPQSIGSQGMMSQSATSHGMMSPQSATPQGMMSPQGPMSQGMISPHMQPPNGFQQHPAHFQRPDASAYQDTRQIAQAFQAERPPQSAEGPRPGMPPQPFSHGQPTQAPGYGPPVDGYYKPDSKPPVRDQVSPGVPQYQQQQPQPAAPQNNTNRRVTSPASTHSPQSMVSPISQRHVSSPLREPQYDTPQIPAAYNHVQGAFSSAGPQFPPHNAQPGRPTHQYGRQHSDPHMQQLSPQVSAQSQMPPNQRTHSDSSASVVSPISSSPGVPSTTPVSNQRPPKQRMSSISETTTHSESGWNLNIPEGATAQEIVRAQHHQYIKQQLAAQQQLQAERSGRSPSPRTSHHTQSPSPHPPEAQQQGHGQGAGGFRELLPRHSPQPYPVHQPPRHSPDNASYHDRHSPAPSHSPHPEQPAPIHPGQMQPPAAYALPISPASADVRSPVNPIANSMPPPPAPPPKIPHSPMHAGFPGSHASPPHTPHTPQHQIHNHDYDHDPRHSHGHSHDDDPEPPYHEPDYDQQPPDEPPPSYDGPGLPHDGMEKERERPRPPNILTGLPLPSSNPRHPNESRQRQASIGILQHPQPASMAASPQRSSADMGANILRRQLLEQEERERAERLQRQEAQRAESQRERLERERARARARELERSVSGGGRVTSLRSVGGSGSGRPPGWERRGSGAGAQGGARMVFELPAEEDEEPVMRATSFPGQEWVPTWTED